MTDSAHQTGTRPLVIAVLNHKGGVGKTTTAINLAATFARAGQRVTLIDLDPQGNAATGLGLERASIAAGTAQVLSGEVTVAEALVDSRQAGLSLLAASPALAGLDIGADDRLLAQALEGVGGLDIAVLDCPPSFGPLGRNALVAADWVVVPVQPESFALEGLTQVTTTIRKIRGAHRKQLGQAVLLTLFDSTHSIDQLVAREVRGHFTDRVLATVIPRDPKLAEAAFRGLPANDLDASAPGAVAYTALAGEILWRASGGDKGGDDESSRAAAVRRFVDRLGDMQPALAGVKETETEQRLPEPGSVADNSPISNWSRLISNDDTETLAAENALAGLRPGRMTIPLLLGLMLLLGLLTGGVVVGLGHLDWTVLAGH